MRSIAKSLAYFPDAAEETPMTRIDQRSVPERSPIPARHPRLPTSARTRPRLTCRLALLELAPAHAGTLKILARTPGMSQCALARGIGTLPSRMVAYVDELERKGLLERRPYESDRRSNACT